MRFGCVMLCITIFIDFAKWAHDNKGELEEITSVSFLLAILKRDLVWIPGLTFACGASQHVALK